MGNIKMADTSLESEKHSSVSDFVDLGSEATIIFRLLRETPMTENELVACLMSEPYGMEFDSVLRGLALLLHNNLVKIFSFQSHDQKNYAIKTYLTTNLGS